ncbi:hypothetical protein EDB86DRAFT_2925952 [Lactarius hatsudake]|nr:hypothetical protein EDB86DRAFT_2925952 [Lactarius hatsudake]
MDLSLLIGTHLAFLALLHTRAWPFLLRCCQDPVIRLRRDINWVRTEKKNKRGSRHFIECPFAAHLYHQRCRVCMIERYTGQK